MSQNITLNDTAYTGITKLRAKKTGSSDYAEFVDTSDANAAASNIASGKTAYVGGSKITGTHSCSGGITPTGDISITENGTFDVTNYAQAIVNVASSGSSELTFTEVTTSSEGVYLTNTSDYGELNVELPSSGIDFYILYATASTNAFRAPNLGVLVANAEKSLAQLYYQSQAKSTFASVNGTVTDGIGVFTGASAVRFDIANSTDNCKFYVAKVYNHVNS